MSNRSSAGILFAFAIAALPLAANAFPAAHSVAGNAPSTPVIEAGCYYDACDCCPRWRYWGPDYWRSRYYYQPRYYGSGYDFHSRYYSHYRWGSYHRLWRYDGWYD